MRRHERLLILCALGLSAAAAVTAGALSTIGGGMPLAHLASHRFSTRKGKDRAPRRPVSTPAPSAARYSSCVPD
jgi:hypothetical protein